MKQRLEFQKLTLLFVQIATIIVALYKSGVLSGTFEIKPEALIESRKAYLYCVVMCLPVVLELFKFEAVRFYYVAIISYCLFLPHNTYSNVLVGLCYGMSVVWNAYAYGVIFLLRNADLLEKTPRPVLNISQSRLIHKIAQICMLASEMLAIYLLGHSSNDGLLYITLPFALVITKAIVLNKVLNSCIISHQNSMWNY